MASVALATNTNSSLISAIRNLVCPLCGASMIEFRCLGYCRSDWRQDWERAISRDQRATDRVRGNSVQSMECKTASSQVISLSAPRLVKK
jgi:hypothetical protein